MTAQTDRDIERRLLRSGIRASIGGAISRHLASNGADVGDRMIWSVLLGDDDHREYRHTTHITAYGRLVDPDPAVRRMDLLRVQNALVATADIPDHRIDRQEGIGRQVVGVVAGTIEDVFVEVRATFTPEDWPEPPPGADLPFGDKAVWPDEACPACGELAFAASQPDDGADWEWGPCERCDHEWTTPDRPEDIEAQRAAAVAELAAAARARRDAQATEAAATATLKFTVDNARAVGVTVRRCAEVGELSPDTVNRWTEQTRRELTARRRELGLPDPDGE